VGGGIVYILNHQLTKCTVAKFIFHLDKNTLLLFINQSALHKIQQRPKTLIALYTSYSSALDWIARVEVLEKVKRMANVEDSSFQKPDLLDWKILQITF